MSNIFQTKVIRTAVASTLFVTSGVAAAFSCPPVVDSIWMATLGTTAGSIDVALVGMLETVAAAKVIDMERVLSAIRVMVKQVEVASSQQGSADIQAKKSAAAYMMSLSSRKAIFNATLDYSGPTGQGFDPCGELARSKNMAIAIGEANRDMQEKVIREIDAAPGHFVADRAAVVSKRITEAQGLYCSPQEASMGLCKAPGAMAGKDTDAANFFTSAHVSAPQNGAKSALLNNMYGLPHQAIPKELAATPAGQSFLEAKRNEDAIRSVSQASMKSIQAMTEARGTGSAQSDSALDSISKKVGTYSGGDNYTDWEKNKMNQTERGLLVEYAKMTAAELYMLNTEYQQWERIESNIAAWQALRAKNMNASGDRIVQGNANVSKVK